MADNADFKTSEDAPVNVSRRNREHAILHASRCVAVNPSDSAPALIALDAKFVVRTPKGERVVDAEDYFIGPDIDITRLHILRPGDLLTAICGGTLEVFVEPILPHY